MSDFSDPLDLSLPIRRKVNILLVDDQPANLLVLEAILEDLGQNLVRSYSGEEALRRLREDEFAVILLDVRMQGLDGFETAKRIRARPETSQTPIIFLTGHDDERLSALEAYKLGAVDYLTKPLVPVILRAKVAGFVELFEKTEQVKRQADQIRQMERRAFERQLAEENSRLRQSEQQFRALADSIPHLAWMARPDGHIFWYNKRWYDYTGTTPDQMEGWGWQAIHDPKELPRVLENWKATLAAGRPWEDTFPLRRHDGAMRWHLSRALPVRDERGRVVRWFGTNTDITEIRQMEEALREADRLKDEFLAMLAHELRNPLAPIRNALHVLRHAGADPTTAARVRDMAERQVKHMARLLDDLLDVSRISRGRIELRQEIIDVATLVQHTVEVAGPFVAERRHELTVSLPDRPLRVKGDPARLEQVLTNLLNNAAKYTEPGGKIWLTATAEGDEAVLRVRDTGVGIAPDMLPKIYDLFVQADRRLDRAPGGVGIGLTLVRRLAEMHGGRVEARSPGLGGGSEFVVRLPELGSRESGIGNREKPSDLLSDSPFPTPDSPVRVLVVDDNQDAADSLALLLRLSNHEVRVAYDGPAALDLAKEFRPALAFLDIGMPGMDGYDLARLLRQQLGQEGTLLVALTGWGQEEDRKRSVAAGFDHHLVKPVEPEALREVLAGLEPRRA
jgi:PAS domain S-box-containing protein